MPHNPTKPSALHIDMHEVQLDSIVAHPMSRFATVGQALGSPRSGQIEHMNKRRRRFGPPSHKTLASYDLGSGWPTYINATRTTRFGQVLEVARSLSAHQVLVCDNIDRFSGPSVDNTRVQNVPLSGIIAGARRFRSKAFSYNTIPTLDEQEWNNLLDLCDQNSRTHSRQRIMFPLIIL